MCVSSRRVASRDTNRLLPLVASATFTTLIAANSAYAADISATSKIDAVTVYRSGAEISSRVTAEIEGGAHTLFVKDLPAEAILSSIRVAGQANGDLQIGAVDAKRVSVLSTDGETAGARRKTLEDELEQLTDSMDQLRAEIETHEARKTFITNLTGLPQQPPMPLRDGVNGAQNWPQLLALIGTSMADVHADILRTRIAMRQLGRQIEDVKKQLAEIAPKNEQRTQVRISLEAGAKLKGDLVIKYQVGNASWRPHYDARLATGTGDKTAELVLTRRASIRQYTGEVWKDVSLKLSTSRPSGKSSAPNLMPLTVDFQRPPTAQPLAQYNRKSAQRMRQAEAQSDVISASPRGGAANLAAKPKAIREQQGRLERTAFQASFGVPGRVTVNNAGEAKRVKLDDQTITPKLSIRTVPRSDTSAYLYAKLQLPRSAPYLAGPVSLFRDGSFVGTGRLPNLAPAAEHELGFGADPSVVVKYHILAEKRGETGIISSSSTDQRNFKIELTNSHEQAIDVVVVDQMPVSLNEDITVALLGPNAPSKRNYENKRGLMAWTFKLEPAAKRSIRFGYTIEWPAEKEVRFGYRR